MCVEVQFFVYEEARVKIFVKAFGHARSLGRAKGVSVKGDCAFSKAPLDQGELGSDLSFHTLVFLCIVLVSSLLDHRLWH